MRALLFCMNDKARFFELETLNCDLKASFSSLVSLFIVTSFLKKWLICPIFYKILPNWGGVIKKIITFANEWRLKGHLTIKFWSVKRMVTHIRVQLKLKLNTTYAYCI